MNTRMLLLLILGLVAVPEAAQAQRTTAPVFSPDGSILAAAAEDATIALWEVATGKKLASLYRPKDSDFLRGSALVWTPTMLFSPDGKTVATQRGDEPAMLWRVADGKQAASLSDGGVIGHLEFSPGGKLLLALGHDDKASGRNRLTLWEVATGKERAALREAEQVEFLETAFSPDGKTYMAVVGSRESDNKTIRIWDTQQHKERASFQGAGARFAPGGKVLAIWDRDGKIELWDAGTGKQQALGSRDGRSG
jgi:WD40 repeat protein